MRNRSGKMRLVLATCCLMLLSACAGYSGRGLEPGVARLADVLSVMGEPAMRWKNADGSEQLAYPRGPDGVHTFMVFVGADGRMESIGNVLDTPHFARVVAGKSDQAAVLRLLGPPVPQWTLYFKARDELAWEWLFCDDTNLMGRFNVLFDGTTGIVRNTLQRQDMRGPEGIVPFCAH